MAVSKETLDSQQSDLNLDSPLNTSQSLNEARLMEVGKCTMEVISANRRAFNRTWKRMSPMIDLIVSACNRETIGGNENSSTNFQPRRVSSIADVGCDHGMLALSLTSMAWAVAQQQNNDGGKENQSDDDRKINFFSKVTGADVSDLALNGSFVSLEKVTDAMLRRVLNGDDRSRSDVTLPIEFRLGSGLEPLQSGEADAVVLAGMGVHTMLNILLGEERSDEAPADKVQTKYIFLQPTNSRPQHMVMMYDQLHQSGWVLRDERIAFLGGRWYINTFFERGCDNNDQLQLENPYRFPGHCLSNDNEVYDTYVKHHLRWLNEDYERPKFVFDEEDRRWMEYIISSKENERWRSFASWYSP